MKAKFVNELATTNYTSREDPHDSFDATRSILLDEIKNHMSEDLLADPTLIVPDKLNDLISVDTHREDPINDLWKTTFVENYLSPIIDALELIQNKTEELEQMEGVGDLDFPRRKKKGIFKR